MSKRSHGFVVLLSLSLGLGGCATDARPTRAPDPVPSTVDVSPTGLPAVPLPPVPPPVKPAFSENLAHVLAFVRRIAGIDHLFLYDGRDDSVTEVPWAFTGGPLLHPFYYEALGEPRVLFNSGLATRPYSPSSNLVVPVENYFGGYYADLIRKRRYEYDKDYFFSVASGDGKFLFHLRDSRFKPSFGVEMQTGDKGVVAELSLQPGRLSDLAVAGFGRWVVAIKDRAAAPLDPIPTLRPIDGELYLYDAVDFRVWNLSADFRLEPVSKASISPTGRYIAIVTTSNRLLLIDRQTGGLDTMPTLNDAIKGTLGMGGVIFIAGAENFFFVESRFLDKRGIARGRLLRYDWVRQLIDPLPIVNNVVGEEEVDVFISNPTL